MDFTLAEILDPIDNAIELIFDFDSYNFYAGLEFERGTLYGWYGTVYFDCVSQIITRTARTELVLLYGNLPIEGTVFKTLRRVHKNTGESTIIFQFNPGNYSKIPNHLIERRSLPAIGLSRY